MGKSIQVDPNKTAKVKYLLNCPKITGGLIMTTIAFDTLELVDKLKTAGIPQAQADAVVL